MKTTLLCAALFIAASFNGYAQNRTAGSSNPSSLGKSSLLLGANGSGSFSQGINGKQKAYVASPWVGYLLHDKLVTGLAVSFSSLNYTSKDTGVTPHRNNTNVSPEVFARYYLMPGKLKPFAELGAGYNFLKSDGAKNNGAYASPSVGLSYWLGQRFALEANYKLKLQSEAMKHIDPAADLRFRIGFSVSLN